MKMKRITIEDLTMMNRAELLTAKQQVDAEIDKIRGHLEAAELGAKAGKPYDADWYRRASRAMRFLGRTSQEIQRRLAEQGNGKPKVFEAVFVRVAERLLQPEVFEHLRDTTFSEMGSED